MPYADHVNPYGQLYGTPAARGAYAEGSSFFQWAILPTCPQQSPGHVVQFVPACGPAGTPEELIQALARGASVGLVRTDAETGATLWATVQRRPDVPGVPVRQRPLAGVRGQGMLRVFPKTVDQEGGGVRIPTRFQRQLLRADRASDDARYACLLYTSPSPRD